MLKIFGEGNTSKFIQQGQHYPGTKAKDTTRQLIIFYEDTKILNKNTSKQNLAA